MVALVENCALLPILLLLLLLLLWLLLLLARGRAVTGKVGRM